jgi:hypothetical protein
MNHVAIVQKGRAGSVARVRMDGALAPLEIEQNAKENGSMSELLKTINLDSVDYQAEAKVIEVLQSHKADAEDAKAKLDSANAEKSKVEAERDSLKEKLDASIKEMDALKAVHVDASEVQKLVKQRVELESFAGKIGVEIKDDMADLELMKAIIVAQAPQASLEGKDETYLRARYDAAVESYSVEDKKSKDSSIRIVNATKADKDDAPVQSYQEKRAAMVADIRNAHKAVK